MRQSKSEVSRNRWASKNLIEENRNLTLSQKSWEDNFKKVDVMQAGKAYLSVTDEVDTNLIGLIITKLVSSDIKWRSFWPVNNRGAMIFTRCLLVGWSLPFVYLNLIMSFPFPFPVRGESRWQINIWNHRSIGCAIVRPLLFRCKLGESFAQSMKRRYKCNRSLNSLAPKLIHSFVKYPYLGHYNEGTKCSIRKVQY